MEFRSDQRWIMDRACLILPYALLDTGPEEDGGEVEVEYSHCGSGALSVGGMLDRGGCEPRSCLRGDVVAKDRTCTGTRRKVASKNLGVPGLSIQVAAQ